MSEPSELILQIQHDRPTVGARMDLPFVKYYSEAECERRIRAAVCEQETKDVESMRIVLDKLAAVQGKLLALNKLLVKIKQKMVAAFQAERERCRRDEVNPLKAALVDAYEWFDFDVEYAVLAKAKERYEVLIASIDATQKELP